MTTDQPTSDTRPSYMSDLTGQLGDPTLATDFPQPRPWTDHWSETETYYFNFFVPELDLDGMVYLKMRPNLGTCHAGVWVYQGVKEHHLQAEHFHFQQFIPYPEVREDRIVVPPLGLSIVVVEEMARHEVQYHDPRTGTSLELRTEAVSPPAMRGNNAHFDQVMRTTGVLVLDGERIPVDCMQVRDRSWGEARPEDPLRHPPACWCTGATADGSLAFTVSGSDDPALDPDMETFGIEPAALFKDGWVWVDGGLRKVVSLSKLSRRTPGRLGARAIEMRFVDQTGEQFHVVGEEVASVPWSPWPAMAITFGCHFKWRLSRSARPDDPTQELRGEAQEICWQDHVRAQWAGATTQEMEDE